MKRVNAVEPPNFLQFEVLEQRLGVEDCILTLGGSYQIDTDGSTTQLVLLTKYQSYLRPRYAWRPVEAFFVSQLHKHILRGLSAEISSKNPAMEPIVAESIAP